MWVVDVVGVVDVVVVVGGADDVVFCPEGTKTTKAATPAMTSMTTMIATVTVALIALREVIFILTLQAPSRLYKNC